MRRTNTGVYENYAHDTLGGIEGDKYRDLIVEEAGDALYDNLMVNMD